MLKFKKITITTKRKRQFVKVIFFKDEVGIEGQVFSAKLTKETNQMLSKSLGTAISGLIPHLLYSTNLTDSSIKLDANMDYPKWFREGHYADDKRFDNMAVTSIEFIGKEGLDAVKIFGYKETEWTDKPFKVKLETPVINLDRVPENHYALVAILDEQIDDIIKGIEDFLEKGDTLSKAQQAELELTY